MRVTWVWNMGSDNIERPERLGGPRLCTISDYRAVGVVVQRRREERGISILHLTDELVKRLPGGSPPVSALYVEALEAGTAAPYLEHLPLLEECLGLPPADLHHLYGYVTAVEADTCRCMRTMTRQEWLSSKEFERALTEQFARAATEAIEEHHRAGRSVYGMVDGRLAEIPPPSPKNSR